MINERKHFIYQASSIFELERGKQHPFETEVKLKSFEGEFVGPGIYIIEYQNRPIYIGKYQPFNRGNIRTDRWVKHLMTFLTCGDRLGLGSQRRVDKILSSPDVSDAYKNVLNKISKKSDNLKDTGTTTSINRMRFSGRNWHNFDTIEKAQNSLEDFSFHYLRYELSAPKFAKKITSLLEQYLLFLNSPECNHEYNDGEHNQLQSIKKMMKELDSFEELVKNKMG